MIILVGILAFTYETTGDLNVQKAMDNVTDTLSDDFDILYKMTDEAYDTEKNEFDFLTFSKSLAAHKDDIGETFPLSFAVSLRYIVTSPKDLLSLGKEAFMTGLLRNAVIVCAVAMPTLVLLVVALCYFVLKQILGLNQDPGELTMISTFRVDRTTAVLMPISFVTTLIALIIRDTGVFYTLSFAAESALSLVCGAAGISTIYYVMENVAGKSKKRCRITAVVLGLLCRLTSFLETVISIIGAYDAFIDIRNRIKKGGDPE